MCAAKVISELMTTLSSCSFDYVCWLSEKLLRVLHEFCSLSKEQTLLFHTSIPMLQPAKLNLQI